MANIQLSGVDIKRLWYADVDAWQDAESVTGESVKALLDDEGTTEILNVHQDTWTIEESESSQDSYKNQLTGAVYRMGKKTMGELSANFTIGRYDYQTKADLLGGTVIKNSKGEPTGWARARGIVEMRKILVGLTADLQYIVLPQTNFNAREANTDGAIGLAVVATAMEPDNAKLASEYWFDESEVK